MQRTLLKSTKAFFCASSSDENARSPGVFTSRAPTFTGQGAGPDVTGAVSAAAYCVGVPALASVDGRCGLRLRLGGVLDRGRRGLAGQALEQPALRCGGAGEGQGGQGWPR